MAFACYCSLCVSMNSHVRLNSTLIALTIHLLNLTWPIIHKGKTNVSTFRGLRIGRVTPKRRRAHTHSLFSRNLLKIHWNLTNLSIGVYFQVHTMYWWQINSNHGESSQWLLRTTINWLLCSMTKTLAPSVSTNFRKLRFPKPLYLLTTITMVRINIGTKDIFQHHGLRFSLTA